MQAGTHCRLEITYAKRNSVGSTEEKTKKGFMYLHNLPIIRLVKNITSIMFSKIKTNLIHYNLVNYDNPKTL